MIETEIVIVGAGIAGNYLAMCLRQEKIPCIIIEKQASFEARPLQCAGIISQKILEIVEFPKEIILNRVAKVKIKEPKNTEIMMQGNEAPIIIDRIKFDAYFGKLAESLGAQFFFNEKYQWHKKTRTQKIIVQTTKRKIKCKFVIGADGPGSRVGKHFHHKIPTIAAAQVRAVYDYPKDQTCMIFNRNWKELFGYVVPEGTSKICRIGLASKKNPGPKLKEFLKSLQISEEKMVDRQGGLIPFGIPDQIVFEKTVLLGDAAGMVKATTGGGIIMTISAANILFKVIKSAYKSQNYTYTYFKKAFERKFMRTLGLELLIHYIIRLFLLEMSPSEFQQLFNLYRSTSVKKVIETEADMDFPLKLMIKLLFTPSFVKYGLLLMIHHVSVIKKIFSSMILYILKC